VTTTVSPVIAQQPGQDGKPGITYRQAGERAVLVEYGEMEFDLALNFLVLAAKDALDEQPPTGLISPKDRVRAMQVVSILEDWHSALERHLSVPSQRNQDR